MRPSAACALSRRKRTGSAAAACSARCWRKSRPRRRGDAMAAAATALLRGWRQDATGYAASASMTVNTPLRVVPRRMEASVEDWSALMVRAQGGDQRAYTTLLTGITPYLRALARRALADPTDIEEA